MKYNQYFIYIWYQSIDVSTDGNSIEYYYIIVSWFKIGLIN